MFQTTNQNVSITIGKFAFVVDLSMKHGDCPWVCQITRGYPTKHVEFEQQNSWDCSPTKPGVQQRRMRTLQKRRWGDWIRS